MARNVFLNYGLKHGFENMVGYVPGHDKHLHKWIKHQTKPKSHLRDRISSNNLPSF